MMVMILMLINQWTMCVLPLDFLQPWESMYKPPQEIWKPPQSTLQIPCRNLDLLTQQRSPGLSPVLDSGCWPMSNKAFASCGLSSPWSGWRSDHREKTTARDVNGTCQGGSLGCFIGSLYLQKTLKIPSGVDLALKK